MRNAIIVTKASGVTEPFQIGKLRHSLTRARASEDEIEYILEMITPRLYSGISTRKIYQEAFRLLRSKSMHHAARYNLKRGMLELGPTGFPFERFVGELFRELGYGVEVDIKLPGKCVVHEVDVRATVDHEVILVECKYRNQAGIAVDVKTPLYIYARFQDLLDNGALQPQQTFHGWIVTNAKFTVDAIAYGQCKSMNMLSWNYPADNSLKDQIDALGLYPLTCLTTLTQREKQWLLERKYVLARDVCNQPELLRRAGVRDSRLPKVAHEGARLCKPGPQKTMPEEKPL